MNRGRHYCEFLFRGQVGAVCQKTSPIAHPRPVSRYPRQFHRVHSAFPRSRSEFSTTDRELRLMAAPAIIGLSSPSAASGMLRLL